MGNKNLVQISSREILELDIMCFMCQMFENGNDLAIIVYGEEENPKRINIEKGFGFTVENDKLEIYIKDEDKTAFTLEKISDYEFWDYDEHIKLENIYCNEVVKIAPIDSITEEEDALCIH